jgi:OFA family oxalate/formate antiporter-like MFS transporter
MDKTDTMTEEKTHNRWLPVVGALLVQLAFGSVYAFSIFTGPLSSSTGYGSTSFQILGIFAIAIAVFAITTIFAGRLQDKKGPRIVATLGGLTYGAGYVIASFFTDNLAMLYVSYGVIGGLGLGLGYVCPLSAVVKWFPDKKGLVSGIAVAGFGAGAFIFTQIGKWIIEGSEDGLANSFLILGLTFTVMVVAGAQLLRNPPAGWMPKGYDPKSKTNGQTIDFEPRETVRTRAFVFLTIMFLLSATAGLMMIGNVKNVANYLDPTKTMLVVAQSQTIAGILALFNGAGRIGWGKVSDHLGRTNTMKLMFLVQALVLFGAAGFVALKPTDEIVQFVGLTAIASAIGFTFGGNFALFPSTTADYFGTKNLGMNYGLVFTGYGAAGVVGSLIPAVLAGSGNGFVWVFVAVGLASLVTFAMAMVLKSPSRKATAAEQA